MSLFKNMWDDFGIIVVALLFLLGCAIEYFAKSGCSWCLEKKRFKIFVLSDEEWGFLCRKCRNYQW